MRDLQYPIGRFQMPARKVPAKQRNKWIDQLEAIPGQLRNAAAGLSAKQLDTPYRPGGWTIRQAIHHIPDSHLNGYVRMKLALTENEPTIKTYEEKSWSEMYDVKTAAPEISLTLLESLHHRWNLLLHSLTARDYARTLRHPEAGVMTLTQMLALYAWHGRHHVSQIQNVRKGKRW